MIGLTEALLSTYLENETTSDGSAQALNEA